MKDFAPTFWDTGQIYSWLLLSQKAFREIINESLCFSTIDNDWFAFIAQQPGIDLDFTFCLYPIYTTAFKFLSEIIILTSNFIMSFLKET